MLSPRKHISCLQKSKETVSQEALTQLSTVLEACLSSGAAKQPASDVMVTLLLLAVHHA